MSDALSFLARGGPVMYAVGACSIVALTVILERLWALQRHRILPRRFLHVVRKLVEEGKIAEARALCESNESPLGAVLAAGIRHQPAGRAVVREAMQDAGRQQVANLERHTELLGAVATIAPLLGLLGTITGMITAFQRVDETIQSTGQVQPGALASGIWEALITTAAGLTVAIPAFLAHRYIIARIDQLVSDLEAVSLDMVDRLTDVAAESTAEGAEEAG